MNANIKSASALKAELIRRYNEKEEEIIKCF